MVVHKKGDFELEFVGDCDSIIRHLEALKEGLKKSELIMGTSRKQVLFEPKGVIDVKIKAKRRDRENRISIKLRWNEKPSTRRNTSSQLVIQGPSTDEAA